jgi:hypothetical protein
VAFRDIAQLFALSDDRLRDLVVFLAAIEPLTAADEAGVERRTDLQLHQRLGGSKCGRAMPDPRDLSGHLPLSRLNSFVMEPSSTEAFKPHSPEDRSDIPWAVRQTAAETRRDVPISRKAAKVTDPKPRYALLSQM